MFNNTVIGLKVFTAGFTINVKRNVLNIRRVKSHFENSKHLSSV